MLERAAERRLLLRTASFGAGNVAVAAFALSVTTLAVSALSVAVGAAYHMVVYGGAGPLQEFGVLGVALALLYAIPFLSRREYTITAILDGTRTPRRAFFAWSMAFLVVGVLAFLTKTSADFSRGVVVLVYLAGLPVVFAAEALLVAVVKAGLASGRIASRRVVVVGDGAPAREFAAALIGAGGVRGLSGGLRVVAIVDLKTAAGSMAQALAAAAATVRRLAADDVVLAIPLAEIELIDAAVETFGDLPVSIHLDGRVVAGRGGDLRVHRLGSATTIAVAAQPLTGGQLLLKRSFDIALSATLLVALAPLMALVALVIRLDSPGPVLFRQARLGQNRRRFTIYKFRSMDVLEDGDRVVQARKNDPRITRVGRWLRRLNLDELPQLWNVLIGDMSLVGPRPHAIAHDADFERRIARYPRRLNVKPGITGWAQVNGLRGETQTDEMMQARVTHDLHYIDNWSLAFDAYILLLTALSPRAYRNAR
ncbi:MAG: exopolysaccharide biosynthesis polyprenyl glycosylphosphotransferase [Hyphomicrobiales bacterium]|nr:exopolysaccharide biosynthesis polyprenyl glycosylphosphotransferase [Hyphomicrobiales bacterium]